MIAVLLSWCLLFITLCGVGRGIAGILEKWTGEPCVSRFSVIHLFWVGCVGAIAVAQGVNLWIPLDGRVLVCLLGMGAWGFCLLCRDGVLRSGWAGRGKRSGKRWLWAVFFLLAIVVAGRVAADLGTTSWSHAYDTDLYHFSALRWMNEYASVPGLANLHSRLGFNAGFLILSAIFDNLWWDLLLTALGFSNILYWFMSAPDLRFGAAFFWIWMGLGGAFLLGRAKSMLVLGFGLAARTLVLSLFSMSLSFLPAKPGSVWRIGQSSSRELVSQAFPGESSGILLYTPVRGDQCGDAPLPCTPYPREVLRLREPGRLQKGFVVFRAAESSEAL